jgi:predicted nucleotidyltransferase
MLKEGRYRAIRNIPVGWVLQAWHSTDKSEKILRLIIELLIYIIFLNAVITMWPNIDILFLSCVSFFLVHTLVWFLTGNFWVYMLDSFKMVKNPGLDKVLSFISLTKRWYEKTDSVEAILIYGSACRNMFHGRSDLDLRVIRRVKTPLGWIALLTGYCLRAYSFFIRMPVDLQVVDSMSFIDKQMRDDENPIVVYRRPNMILSKEGIPFEEILKSPRQILKKSDK